MVLEIKYVNAKNLKKNKKIKKLAWELGFGPNLGWELGSGTPPSRPSELRSLVAPRRCLIIAALDFKKHSETICMETEL